MSKIPEFEIEIRKISASEGIISDFQLKCPHCGHVYVEDRYHGDELDRELINKAYIRYGSPIRCCEKCGKEFLDRGFREIMLEKDEIKSKLSKNRRIGWMMVFAGMIAAIVGLLTDFEIAGVIGLIGLAVIVSGLVKVLTAPKGLKTSRELKEERILSAQRISDPEYMEKLRDNGVVD